MATTAAAAALTVTEEPSAERPQFTMIVLTGGPCGGKTTAMAEVSERLRSLGLQVFIQPEVSTMLSIAGAGFPAAHGPEYRHAWEVERLKFQLSMESTFAGIARASKMPTVLLCDRGTGDSAAYCEPAAWHSIAAAAVPGDQNPEAALVMRYDLVLHLVSAAVGAAAFYDKSANSARRESVDEAVEVDRNVFNAWNTHPNRRVIDNSTDFAGKIRRVVMAICNHLGVASPALSRKRFVVSRPLFNPPKDLRVEEFEVTYTFLAGSTENENWCLRSRLHNGRRTVTYSHKRLDGRITERSLSSREAKDMLRRQPGAKEAQQFTRKRRVFVWREQYYELDDHDSAECILQVEVATPDVFVVFPEWLSPAIIKVISPENSAPYSLYGMAVRLTEAKAAAEAAAEAEAATKTATTASTKAAIDVGL